MPDPALTPVVPQCGMVNTGNSAFEQSLHGLVAELVRMLSLVRHSNDMARRALLQREVAAAEECSRNDEEIDRMLEELEQSVITIIARHQPAARDVRFLGAVYRSLADVERAGDYALHVARTGAELAGSEPIKKYQDLTRIMEVIDEMIDHTMKALTESDADAARVALAMDDEIDVLEQQIQRELLTLMMENPKVIGPALLLMNTTRYLERLGDHIENVNEHLIFWMTGERI